MDPVVEGRQYVWYVGLRRIIEATGNWKEVQQ